ncbi:hypothetical protein [Leptospira stimsonii]|uniref:TIGR04388 family protein n=1 Tax=Leptospira stimsonii TaxID=2202203 RepID=A0ABY2N3V3_9LEPT|nr:hypothetical protein [Leptospira stimsonii]TGK15532.1 hypothetical protein EHO98_15200 [Leptospira stimsonii]TGM16457.1 hypothetical protein EHQ90_09995 [Leptospira stimsonii]
MDQGIDYLDSLLTNWDEVEQGMTEGLDNIRTNSSDYLAYATANAGIKGTLAYSDRMLQFSGELQGGVAGIGQFQSYLNEIGQTKQYLDTVLLDTVQTGDMGNKIDREHR